jgi:hypothetical protein
MVTPTVIQESFNGRKNCKIFVSTGPFTLAAWTSLQRWLAIYVYHGRSTVNLDLKGITIRKSTDCLIAQVAIQNDVLLNSVICDFELIAKGSELVAF